MKLTLNWLKDHLETTNTLNEILDGLLKIGLEVEEVTDFSAKLKGFSVAKILEAKKHENADSLRVCSVETSEGIKQIVCGAPNARTGIKVLYAKEGTYVAGTNITIKKTNIRGVDSFGMMVSERELELSDEHDGIIEIDDSFNVGELATKALNLEDILIDVSVTANVAHLLGIRWIARELAAYGYGKFKEIQSYEPVNEDFITSIKLNIEEKIADKFLIVEAKGVDNSVKSPAWLKSRLKMIGTSCHSPLVDLTNYLAIDMGQPMHVYDKDKLGSTLEAVFSKEADKTFLALNGKEYNLKEGLAIIKSDNKIEGVAGVIGGEGSSVTKDTKNVIIEVASFSAEEITKSRRFLAVSTDSSYRFERGVDRQNGEEVMNLMCFLAKWLTGGNYSKIKKLENKELKLKVIDNLSITKINNLLGINLSKAEVKNYLEKLDFKVEDLKEDSIKATVPNYRFDVIMEADIAEEILKIHGIDNLEEDFTNTFGIKKDTNKSFLRTEVIKNSLAAKGLSELINLSFISKKEAESYNIFDSALELANPISSELSVLRKSLVPSLVQNVIKNTNKGYKNFKIFEVASIFEGLEVEAQKQSVAFSLVGLKHYKDWRYKNTKFDVFDAKELLFSLLEDLNFKPENMLVTRQGLKSYYHPYRSGSLYMGNNLIGHFGELNPKIATEQGVKNNVVIGELFISNLPLINTKNTFSKIEISNLMPLERDFSFVIKEEVEAFEIVKQIKLIDKKLIKEVKVFDYFKLEETNEIAVGISITLEPLIKTLTEEEIKVIYDKIVETVKTKLNAKFRL